MMIDAIRRLPVDEHINPEFDLENLKPYLPQLALLAGTKIFLSETHALARMARMQRIPELGLYNISRLCRALPRLLKIGIMQSTCCIRAITYKTTTCR